MYSTTRCIIRPVTETRCCRAGLWVTLPLLLMSPLLAKQLKEGATTSSTPIAITSDDRYVWVVNPDNNSVSVIQVFRDVNQKVAEIPVGDEPRFLAITPNDHRLFVSNSRAGTVSMISPSARRVLATIQVGTGPAGL